jgi:serine/threonine protein kinase/WD40 repeat protein
MSVCLRCQRPLPSVDIGGNCPACLLDSALRDEISDISFTDIDSFPYVIGGYEIIAEIGRGGTSVVYRARQQSVKRLVALKVLHGSALTSRDAFDRLRIEAQAVGRLDHPNIVSLHEVGRDGGLPFISLRYFERGSLAQALAEKRFTPREAAQLISIAARAVHHAHQRGVLHRDLKPSNLLLDEEGRPHITDFGLAKLADGDTSLTLSTSVLGTPAYMAPEQAAGFAKIASIPADLYSLGAILFEMLTGRPPFLGQTALEVLRQVADDEPPRPRSLNPKLHRDLEAICLHCLEKEPEKRYSSAATFADDLDHWLRYEPITIRPATSLGRGLKWVRRRPLVAALAASVIFALLAGIAGTTWQWHIARRTAQNARLDAYFTSMDLVQRVVDNQPPRAKAILDRYRPAPGEKDLRGWEWRYNWQLCRGNRPEKKWLGDKGLFSTALSQDGKLIAVGEMNGGAKIFDTATLQLIYTSPAGANTDPAPHVASGNVVGARVIAIPGTTLFAWSETRSISSCVIEFWDWNSQKIVRSFPQPYIVRNMVPSPDGRRLIVSYQTPDGRTIVWDLETEKIITQVPKANGYSNYSVGCVLAVSPDGKWMTVDDFPDYVRVLEVETGKDLWRFPLQDQYCLASEFSPDGKILAVYGGFIKGTSPELWDLQTGKSLGRFESVSGWIARILFSPDGRQLITGGTDHLIRVWDTAGRKLIKEIRTGLPGVLDLALSANGATLFSVSQGNLQRWNLNSTYHPNGYARLPIARSWKFLLDSKHILGVTTNGTAGIFSGPEWEDFQEFKTGATNVSAVDLLPNGSGYVVGARDGSISARRWSDHSIIKQLGSMSGSVEYLRVDSKSGTVTASDGIIIKVWDIASACLLALIRNAPSLQASADLLLNQGRWTLLSYAGSALHLDLANGAIAKQRLPFAKAEGFSYSQSGKFAVTSGADSPVRIYRAIDWQPLRTLSEESSGGFFVCLSPDDQRIATGHGGDDAVRLWDTATGRRVGVLSGDIDLARETRFSPDGNVIAQSGSVMNALCLWWAPTWEEIARTEAAGDF